MRVVLDTNVIVSAGINPRGTPAMVLEAWEQGKFDWIMSPALFGELESVLRRDSLTRYTSWTPDRRERLISSARRSGQWVEPTQTLHVVAADPDDDRFLEAAIAGEADYMVTGDRHLLDLRTYEGVEIVTPVVFLTLLQMA